MAITDECLQIVTTVLDVKDGACSASTRLIDDLGADSLDIIEITMTIEEKYDIVFNDEDSNSVVTFGDLVKVVESKLIVSRAH